MRRWISLALFLCLMLSCAACTGKPEKPSEPTVTAENADVTAEAGATEDSGSEQPADRTPSATGSNATPGSATPAPGKTSATTKNSVLFAKSDTGVSATTYINGKSDKQVGIFYFIWQGTGVGASYAHVYDNTEILSKLNLAGKNAISLSEWQAAGGGSEGTWHWWGQPLFGYYDMADEWVVTRHMQMLADAGVDYILIDQTNGVLDGYIKRINLVFSVLYKLQQQGVKVPQVAMMCYDDGPGTVNKLYVQLYAKHPEYKDLFYHWNGHAKPVIFDNISGYNKTASAQIVKSEKLASYSAAARDFFEFRDVAFPHESKGKDPGNSMLYLDFRATPKAVVDPSDGYSFVNVSVAEICVTNSSLKPVLKDTGDRTRNWDGSKNRNWSGESNAYLYGYNFKREFEAAIAQNPDMIFITGWNEWMAQLHKYADGTVNLVDNADINNSRDIEPMKGGYGDNYYIQMCDFISRFKYGSVKPAAKDSVSVNVNGAFSQWDNASIQTFADYTGETMARNCTSACDWKVTYKQDAGENDIALVKVASDSSNLYVYVQTTDAIRDAASENRMSVFLNTGSSQNWNGYDFVVNRTAGSAVALEQCQGGWSWKTVGTVSCKTEGNQMMIEIPRKMLGLSAGSFTVYLKVADAYTSGDLWSFYTQGDCAPYGRMSYAYSGK